MTSRWVPRLALNEATMGGCCTSASAPHPGTSRLQTTQGGCAGVSPATTIVAGNRLPGIPVNSTYAELGWRHAPSGFVATVEVRHAGQLWVNDGNTDAAKSYTIGNLRLGMEQRSGRWAFSEFFRVDNVTDQKYVGTVIVNESLGRYFEPSPGRNELFGASARYVF